MADLRDRNAMQLALAGPRNLVAYGSPDAAALAASHAYGLLRNHPFSTGTSAPAMPLLLCSCSTTALSITGSDIESVEVMLAVASGTMSEDDLAAWFRARVRPM